VKKLDEWLRVQSGSLDVPGRLPHPEHHVQPERRPYESLLGGSADDPLIRLLARGSAGYRTAAKALHYALQQPALTVESISNADNAGLSLAKLRVEDASRGAMRRRRAVAAEVVCRNDALVSVTSPARTTDLQKITAARDRKTRAGLLDPPEAGSNRTRPTYGEYSGGTGL